MNTGQATAAVKQVLGIIGIVIAFIAVFKLFGVAIPFARADLMQLAAVSAACVFAAR